MNQKKKWYFGTWAIILYVLVLFMIVGIFLPSDSTPSAESSQKVVVAKKTSVKSLSKPYQDSIDKANIEQLIYNVVHGKNKYGEDYVRSIDVIHTVDPNNPIKADGSLNSTGQSVDISLNIDGSKLLMQQQMADIYISLYQNRKDIKIAQISAYLPVTDKYGNNSDAKIYHTFLNVDEAQKINWSSDKETLEFNILPKVWTVNYDLSATNPNLFDQ